MMSTSTKSSVCTVPKVHLVLAGAWHRGGGNCSLRSGVRQHRHNHAFSHMRTHTAERSKYQVLEAPLPRELLDYLFLSIRDWISKPFHGEGSLVFLPMELGLYPVRSLQGQKMLVSFVNREKQSKLGATVFGAGKEGVRQWLLSACLYIRELDFHALVHAQVLVLAHALIKEQLWTMLFNLMILISTWGSVSTV